MPGGDDPRCPECGGPIGQTSTYCMHCSADLTEERAAADADDDGVWDGTEASSAGSGGRTTVGEATSGSDGTNAGRGGTGTASTTARESTGRLLDPDGIVDDTLTVVVGIAGGIVVGVVGIVVLAAVTGSAWALVFGVLAWLGTTAHLVRRRTVQGAVARTGYAVAVVLLFVPVIALSPFVDVEGGVAGRGGLFLVLLLFVAIPTGVAAAIGWIASRFVPAGDGGSEV